MFISLIFAALIPHGHAQVAAVVLDLSFDSASIGDERHVAWFYGHDETLFERMRWLTESMAIPRLSYNVRRQGQAFNVRIGYPATPEDVRRVWTERRALIFREYKLSPPSEDFRSTFTEPHDP